MNKGRIFVIDTDNPYPFKFSAATYPENQDSSRLFVGVNEKMAVNIARGIANTGRFPIFASPATHLQGTAEDFMRCAIDRDPVLLVGFWPGSDLAHWGPTHNSNRDSLLFSFPGVSVLQSATLEDIGLILNALYKNPNLYLPAYFRLPADTFDQKRFGLLSSDTTRAFADGFYYFHRSRAKLAKSRVLFAASGSVQNECARAMLILEKKNISCSLINVLNLRHLGNSKLLNKMATAADIIISVIDADPTSLEVVLFDALQPEQRHKVIIKGLKDFNRGLYSREDIFHHNQIDARSLAELAIEHLLSMKRHEHL